MDVNGSGRGLIYVTIVVFAYRGSRDHKRRQPLLSTPIMYLKLHHTGSSCSHPALKKKKKAQVSIM